MAKTARHRIPDRNPRKVPPKIEIVKPRNNEKSTKNSEKDENSTPDDHFLESKIKFELIGCITWILAQGIHQIQTGQAEQAAVYKLCAIKGLSNRLI